MAQVGEQAAMAQPHEMDSPQELGPHAAESGDSATPPALLGMQAALSDITLCLAEIRKDIREDRERTRTGLEDMRVSWFNP